MVGVPFGIPNSRLADVFLIGPITVLFSFFVKEEWLSLFILFSGILTIVYNGINWANINTNSQLKWIPESWRKNFIHPIRGKTQLVRLLNLLIMYPLFIYAFWIVTKRMTGKTCITQKIVVVLFGIFAILGFLYNLKNFLSHDTT